MALGAHRGDVSRLVLRDGAKLTVWGVLLGLVAAGLLTRWMASLLFGVSATDVATYLSVSLFVSGIALLASYLPAHRAARVPPIQALRWE